MKKKLLAAICGLVMAAGLFTSSEVLAARGCGRHNDILVSGYFRSNGTYVAPHFRTLPNHTQRDNWGCRPNINPHTGRRGTRIPLY